MTAATFLVPRLPVLARILFAIAALVAPSCCSRSLSPTASDPNFRDAAADSSSAAARDDERVGDATTFEEAFQTPSNDSQTPKPGLLIGERAPSFALEDQHGKRVSLESLLEKGPIALVFFRSADW